MVPQDGPSLVMQHLFLFTWNKRTFQKVHCVYTLCVLSCRTCWVTPINRALSAGLGPELLRYLFCRGQISAECILTLSPLSPVPCNWQHRWRTSQRQPQAPWGTGAGTRPSLQPPAAACSTGPWCSRGALTAIFSQRDVLVCLSAGCRRAASLVVQRGCQKGRTAEVPLATAGRLPPRGSESGRGTTRCLFTAPADLPCLSTGTLAQAR